MVLLHAELSGIYVTFYPTFRVKLRENGKWAVRIEKVSFYILMLQAFVYNANISKFFVY